MTDTKPWYLSRTIWASLVTVMAAAASYAGISLDEADGEAITDALLQAVTALSALVAIYGRLSARDRIR